MYKVTEHHRRLSCIRYVFNSHSRGVKRTNEQMKKVVEKFPYDVEESLLKMECMKATIK